MKSKAEKLVQIREFLGLNPYQFAKKLDMNPSNYYQIEAGSRNIGKHLSNDLINRLGINPDWWEGDEGDMFVRPVNNTQQGTGNINAVGSKGVSSNIGAQTPEEKVSAEKIIRLETQVEMLEKEIERLTEIIKSQNRKD